MSILILGGTGAIGVPTIELLAEQGEEIYVTSRRERESIYKNVHYIKGNAHDMDFLNELLKGNYDVIIDFMIYSTSEFHERYKLFLNNSKQYVFFSSSRVFAEEETLTEQSPRLLDVVDDVNYLKSTEYALEKARQEDILTQSGYKNWTIIRPYITYNNERLQLGIFEKEQWLYRALHGRSILFSKDVADKYTTLTHGSDVARRLINIVGCSDANGQVYNITTEETAKWNDILEIYLNVIEECIGREVDIHMVESAYDILKTKSKYYQLKYDRLINRKFDNKKINNICDCDYTPLKKGLSIALKQFIEEQREFRTISWAVEAQFDKVTGERTPMKEINGMKNKIKYLLYRYTPYSTLKEKRMGK